MNDFRLDENGKFKHGYSRRDWGMVWPSCFVMNDDGGFDRITEEEAARKVGTYKWDGGRSGHYNLVWLSLVEDFHPLQVSDDEQLVIARDGQDFIAKRGDEEIFRNPYASVVLEFAVQKLRSPIHLESRYQGSYAVQLTHLNDKALRREYKADLAHGGYHQDEIKAEMDSRGHIRRGGVRERIARIKTAIKNKRGGGRRDR